MLPEKARLATLAKSRIEVCHMMTSRLAHLARLKKITAALKNQRGKADRFQGLKAALDLEFDELMTRVDLNNTAIVANTVQIDDL